MDKFEDTFEQITGKKIRDIDEDHFPIIKIQPDEVDAVYALVQGIEELIPFFKDIEESHRRKDLEGFCEAITKLLRYIYNGETTDLNNHKDFNHHV